MHSLLLCTVECIKSRSSSLLQYGTEYKEFNRHKIENPPGWIFIDKWKVDVNRIVDGEGKEIASCCHTTITLSSQSLSLILTLSLSLTHYLYLLKVGSTQKKMG